MATKPDPIPSEKQLEILAYIVRYVEAHGYQPSQDEMAAEFGVYKNAIRMRLKRLEERGLIKLTDSDRAIELPYFKFRASKTRDLVSGTPLADAGEVEDHA
jgi:SOS-response transcriptional repressor LexA